MTTVLSALVSLLSFRLRGRASLELELATLRHQVTGLQRQLCVPKIRFDVDAGNKQTRLLSLITELFRLILGILLSLAKARAELAAENLVLRQQIDVLRR